MQSYQTIKTILRTEKAVAIESQGKYLFQVASRANKVQIRKAVEEIYKVNVVSVNTAVLPGKRKRVRQEFGHTANWKKAVVTLKAGQKIDLT